MNELVVRNEHNLLIDRHPFEEAKQRIQEFSQQPEKDIELPTVEMYDDYMIFFATDHKVTGSELNDLTRKVQQNLIESNKIEMKLIREFGTIYNALEALDKQYITAILNNLQEIQRNNDSIKVAQEDLEKQENWLEQQNYTIEKALNELREHSKALEKVLEKAQRDWKITVETQIKIVEKLKEVNDTLNLRIRTLEAQVTAVEEVLNDLQIEEMRNIARNVSEIEMRMNEMEIRINNEINNIRWQNIKLKQDYDKLLSEILAQQNKQNDELVNKIASLSEEKDQFQKKLQTMVYCLGGTAVLAVVALALVIMEKVK